MSKTTSHKGIGENILEKQLRKRLKWFVLLRMMAVAGVSAVLGISHFFLPFTLQALPQLLIGNIVLFLLNVLFYYYQSYLESKRDDENWYRKAKIFTNIQISFDISLLAYFIHFSGGIENPFVFYFIFHMIIASILLPNRTAYWHATSAVMLMGLVSLGECSGLLSHYHLIGFYQGEHYNSLLFICGILFVFASTLYIAVFMTTSIMNQLRLDEYKLFVANKKLEEQDRIKSQYVQIVSHDILAPLSAVQSCLNVVLTGMTGPITDKSKEMIARAERRSMSLCRFAKELLDLSRMRVEREIPKHSMSLGEVMRKVVDTIRPQAEKKGLSLHAGDTPADDVLQGDAASLERLFDNLISNAVRYTPAGGKVSVQIKDRGAAFYVEVTDTGIGISPSDLPSVFEDFFRAKNGKALEKDGTGLGLSIARQIVQVHQGQIGVESELDKGSCFYFVLPKTSEKPQKIYFTKIN